MKCKSFTVIILSAAAVAFLSIGCSKKAKDAGTFLQLAAKEAQNGKNSDALMLARDACILSPDNVDALLMRSLMAERCNDRTLAMDSALQALKLAPDYFAALYTVGRLYSYNKDTAAEAMGYLEKAYALQENDTNTLILLANLAVSLRSPKALDYLLKIDSLDSEILNSFEGKTMLGHAYALRGDKRQAIINFGRAFRDYDEQKIVSNYNFAVAIDCLYNKPSMAVSKYKLFLKQSASKQEFASLRKSVERRLKKITPRSR